MRSGGNLFSAERCTETLSQAVESRIAAEPRDTAVLDSRSQYHSPLGVSKSEIGEHMKLALTVIEKMRPSYAKRALKLKKWSKGKNWFVGEIP